MRFSAGDLLSVRGATWVVDDATSLTDCTRLALTEAEASGTPRSCTILLPFDRPVASARIRRIAAVTPRKWMRQLYSMVRGVRLHGRLREAARASIDILPFQLEPALALLDGAASRFLLADEVGLGKTIQAGLMLAEMVRRGWCERALIVVPSGLRVQWSEELKRRFEITSAIVDAETLSRLTDAVPHGVNPWCVEPVIITSIDFIKQAEVLHALKEQLWDMLIVDEAHHATPGSLRYEAAAVLARRSRHVVLLTATPHGGDVSAYRALCQLGEAAPNDPMLLFRRTRHQAGVPRVRRVHLLPVRLTEHERTAHRLLESYVARLWRIAQSTGSVDIRLVATVLSKRAFSSACSLALSIERRLEALSGVATLPAQPRLFDSDVDPLDEAPPVSAPGFSQVDEETQALQTLHVTATRAGASGESKVHALRKLLRRIREPVIVFTEYRDTLETLERELRTLRRVSVLHGGQSPEERRDAIRRFTSGSSDLLLATDAGAEGLNLHGVCRVVVNLELPWNPIRLEQRVGRVDRIGQQRTVHAFNLYADGTAESRVLAALARRLGRIRASEIEVAASVISNAPLPPSTEMPRDAYTETVDLRMRADAEASRTAEARRTRHVGSGMAEGKVPVTRVGPIAFTSLGIQGASVVFFVRVRIVNGAGRLVEEMVIPLAVPGSRSALDDRRRVDRLRRRDVRRAAEQTLTEHGYAVATVATSLGHERASTLAHAVTKHVRRAIQREQWITKVAARQPMPIQRGLFDHRALRTQLAEQEHFRAVSDDCASRATLLEADTALAAEDPRIEMMLLAW